MGTQTATILVSDLVGSTALRAGLGEDRAEEVRRLHDRALSDAAERAGGTVVKGLGDGFLVQFAGAAEAVGAAVAMQQTVETLARREGLDLSIRVGLSSGDVTVEDGDCFGIPVVEASRLCSAAGADEIYAAAVVTVLARGRGSHVVEAVGPLDLKGLPESLDVDRIGWEPVQASADLRATAPYVGREHERAVLHERFAAAASGEGGLVLIAGEPGIGKTRLVSEVCRDVATDPGATVLVGGCHDGEVGAFAPFVEAVTDWLRATPTAEVATVLGSEAAVIGRVAPAVRTVLPDLPAPADLAPADAEARLNDAFGQVLTRMSATRPVVLVLDDLHWADAATVALLRVVARKATTLPVLVIGTYRDTDLDRRHPLAEALPLLRREVEPTRLALDGLPASSVRQLLERLADHEVPDAFVDLLTTQTDGNPFFLREMLIHLTEVGALRFEDGVWVADADLATAIPEGVREVVGRRLSQLSEPAQKLLGVGALFEVAFPLAETAVVAGLEEDEALDAVDEALAAQVVLSTEVFDHYEFSHALFRQTLVTELNPSRQVRTHRAIAEALDKRLDGLPTPDEAAALARHWHLSAAIPGAERGVPAALVLAADATDRYAHREAFDALTIALELLPEGDERTAEVLWSRAEAGIRGRVEGRSVLDDVRLAAGLLADADQADAAADVVAELVATAWAVGDRSRAWALASIGRELVTTSRRDRTWVLLREAELQEIEFADEAHSGLPLDDEARRELQAALENLDPEDLVGLQFVPSSRAAVDAFLAKDPPAGAGIMAHWARVDIEYLIPEFDGWLGEYVASGNFDGLVLGRAVLARCLTIAGRHQEADESLARAYADLPRVPATSNAAFQTLAAESLMGYVRGRFPSAATGEMLRELAENPDTRWASLAVMATNGVIEATAGRRGEALAFLESAMVGVERAPGYAPNYPLIACMATEALWLLDDQAYRETIEANLLAKVIEPDLRYAEVLAPLAMARLCALGGRVADGRAWCGRSRAMVEEQATPPLMVQIDNFEAEWEVRLGAEGDPERFASTVASARAGCTDPAMAPWLDRFDRLERAAGETWS